MNRKHIMLLVIGLVVAAAASVTYLKVIRPAGPSELEIIERLVEASINEQETIAKHKVKQAMARSRARRICAQAVELWAAFAHRCSGEDAAGKERLREAVRQAASKTLACHRIWTVGTGEAVDRCFAFLMTGSCHVLRREHRELPRSPGGAAAKASKPQPHLACQGVF